MEKAQAIEIGLSCLQGILGASMIYAAVILGIEVGAESRGNPGYGLAIHKKVVETLKSILLPNRKK